MRAVRPAAARGHPLHRLRRGLWCVLVCAVWSSALLCLCLPLLQLVRALPLHSSPLRV